MQFHKVIEYGNNNFFNIFQGLEVRKVAFIAICQGEELNIRTQKVCNGYRVNIYPCPKSNDERLDTLDKLREETLDIEQVRSGLRL